MTSFQTLVRRMHEVYHLPYGESRITAATELATRIQQENVDELLPNALMLLVESYMFSSRALPGFAVYAKLLKLYDTRPELFAPSDVEQLFWQFKWIADDVAHYAEFSLAQCDALLTDMQRRFALAGFGLKAPLAARFSFAAQTGAPDAEQARLNWLRQSPDEFDDCPACVIGAQVDYFVQLRDWQQAITLGRTQQESCNIEPIATNHYLALAFLMADQPALALERLQLAQAAFAASEHRRSGFSAARGAFFETLGRGGALAWFSELLESDYRAFEVPEKPSINTLRLALGMLAGARALIAAGHGAATVDGGVCGNTISGVAEFFEELAKPVAARFDARNGNDFYIRKLELARAAQPSAQPLPL